MRIVFVSNGAGEDGIAANVASALIQQIPTVSVSACPLLGSGGAYRAEQISVVTQSEMPPSGGFVRSVLSVVKDLSHGVVGQQLKHRRLIKSLYSDADAIVAVGDVYCLALAATGFNGTTIFMPTAKSDRFMPHSRLELRIMTRLASLVIPRDQETAVGLCNKGMDAVYCGNPMMDKIKVQHTLKGWAKGDHNEVVGIMPGSRAEALGNLVKQLDVVSELVAQGADARFVVAKAPSVLLSHIRTAIASTLWCLDRQSSQDVLVHSQSGLVVVLSESFGDVVHYSTWCLGMAGTANEQAAHYGRFVYTFVGTGPQSTAKRFKEQVQLMGPDKIRFIEATRASQIAAQILEDRAQKGAVQVLPVPFNTDASTSVAKLIAERLRLA